MYRAFKNYLLEEPENMSGEAKPSRRELERAAIILEVNYNTEMEFLNSSTKNLNSAGMFIRTLYPLPEGTELNVKFAIPEISITFSVVARVVWAASSTESSGGDEPGMGINFINLSSEKSAILEKYIESKLALKK